MTSPAVLVLEPDSKTRDALGQTLAELHFRPVLTGSLDDALQLAVAGDVDAVIADCGALVRLGSKAATAPALAARLGASIAQLRAARAGSPGGAPVAPVPHLRVIVTSEVENAAAHAAAIQAGADAFLRATDAQEESVIASYLTRFLQASLATLATASVIAPVAAPPAPVPAPVAAATVLATPARPALQVTAPATPAHVSDAFALQDEDLRDPDSGRWDAKRIAEVLGISLRDLTDAISVNYSTVARTPDSDGLQERLAPFANVTAMVRQVHAQDDGRVRKWLRQPQPALQNDAPLTVLLRPGAAAAVEQWVTGAWLGEPA